jgi:hypothetical protein
MFGRTFIIGLALIATATLTVQAAPGSGALVGLELFGPSGTVGLSEHAALLLLGAGFLVMARSLSQTRKASFVAVSLRQAPPGERRGRIGGAV